MNIKGFKEILRETKDFEGFEGFWGILRDFEGFWGILRDLKRKSKAFKGS